MIQKTNIPLICLLIIFAWAFQTETVEALQDRKPLELAYIANEGVMLSVNDKKILIDALFNNPNPEYLAPSKEILKKMIACQSPFDKISLVLVTHNHPDHFDAAFAVQFMEKHNESTLIAPVDAVDSMKVHAKDWSAIESRIISLDLDVGQSAQRETQDISIHAYRTLHSGLRASPENLVYLLNVDGWRVLHEGDSDGQIETFQKMELGNDPIDLALVHFWFPLNPDAARILQEVLKLEHIALIHLPKRLEEKAPGDIEKVKKYYKDIFLLMPGMKSRTFH